MHDLRIVIFMSFQEDIFTPILSDMNSLYSQYLTYMPCHCQKHNVVIQDKLLHVWVKACIEYKCVNCYIGIKNLSNINIIES